MLAALDRLEAARRGVAHPDVRCRGTRRGVEVAEVRPRTPQPVRAVRRDRPGDVDGGVVRRGSELGSSSTNVHATARRRPRPRSPPSRRGPRRARRRSDRRERRSASRRGLRTTRLESAAADLRAAGHALAAHAAPEGVVGVAGEVDRAVRHGVILGPAGAGTDLHPLRASRGTRSAQTRSSGCRRRRRSVPARSAALDRADRAASLARPRCRDPATGRHPSRRTTSSREACGPSGVKMRELDRVPSASTRSRKLHGQREPLARVVDRRADDIGRGLGGRRGRTARRSSCRWPGRRRRRPVDGLGVTRHRPRSPPSRRGPRRAARRAAGRRTASERERRDGGHARTLGQAPPDV